MTKLDEIGSMSLVTTFGEIGWDSLPPGLILPHEHIFVDLRSPDEADPGAVDPAAVVGLMAPELKRAQAAGVGVLVVCTPLGVGRRADLVLSVSRAADMPVVMPTGVYREPWIPRWVHEATESELRAWMLRELQEQVEGAGVRAGWIKLSAGDDGMTSCERKVLRAAAEAAVETGAVIGSHTIKGRVVMDQLDVIESSGYTPERFIWIHTQAEPDVALHEAVAQRGAWVEYDAVGSDGFSDEDFIEHIHRMLGLGYGRQLLLSHDRGWYDPAQPGGGTPRPFTYISETFLPKLRASGVDDATIRLLTRENPFRAFGRV
jgi:phosphotriesterase-related protein